MLLRVIRSFQAIEISCHLNGGVAMKRRACRHPLVNLDGQFRLLEGFVQIGKREQRKRMAGAEKQGQLQVNEAQIFATAAAERRTEAIERFSSARLSIRDKRRQFFTRLEIGRASCRETV